MIYYLENTVLHTAPDDVVCKRQDITPEELNFYCRDEADHLYSRSKAGLRAKASRMLTDAIDKARELEALLLLSNMLPGEFPQGQKDLSPAMTEAFDTEFDALSARLSALKRGLFSGALQEQQDEAQRMLEELYQKGCKILPNGETPAMIAEALLEEFVARLANPNAHKGKLIKKFAAILGGVVRFPSLASIRAEQRMTHKKERARALGAEGNLNGAKTKKLIRKGKMAPKTPKVVFDGF